MDLERFQFTIAPPLYGVPCIVEYLVAAESSEGTRHSISVSVTNRAVTVVDRQGVFDVCRNSYNFTAAANTLIGPGADSTVVYMPSKLSVKMTSIACYGS